MHSIHADTSNRQVLSMYGTCQICLADLALGQDVLQKRPSTPTLKIHAIEYLRTHTRSFDYTLSVLATMEGQVREEIARLGGNKGLEALVEYLHVKVP